MGLGGWGGALGWQGIRIVSYILVQNKKISFSNSAATILSSSCTKFKQIVARSWLQGSRPIFYFCWRRLGLDKWTPPYQCLYAKSWELNLFKHETILLWFTLIYVNSRLIWTKIWQKRCPWKFPTCILLFLMFLFNVRLIIATAFHGEGGYRLTALTALRFLTADGSDCVSCMMLFPR
jgi:hypothetical protein